MYEICNWFRFTLNPERNGALGSVTLPLSVTEECRRNFEHFIIKLCPPIANKSEM
jgi:hypothetical protein